MFKFAVKTQKYIKINTKYCPDQYKFNTITYILATFKIYNLFRF